MFRYLLVFCFITSSIYAQSNMEKHQRARVFYDSQEALMQLETLGIPIDHGQHKKNVFLISEFSVSEINIMKKQGFEVEILIEDAKAHFLAENAKRAPARNLTCAESQVANYPTPSNFNLGSMGGFLTYQELLDELEAMHDQYPDLISAADNISTFTTQGQPDNNVSPSIGNNGIKWVRISDNPTVDEAEPEILYTAIHHAREPMSLSQLVYYMWYLLENYETDTEIQGIVNNTELYFIPVINPDGYLFNERTDPNGGGFWRKNRRNNGGNTFGVDNNRNYDYFINGDPNNNVWGGEGSSGDPNNQVYRGTAPFSEVENQAIRWFVEQHNFVMAFNNHSFGNLLLYPFGYTSNAPTPENDLFDALSEELVSQNGYDNIISAGLSIAAGDSDDYMYGTVGTHEAIYAFTPEIGPAFWPPSNQIDLLAKGMMFHNITAAKMVNNYAEVSETSPLYTGTSGIVELSIDVRRLGINGEGNFTISIEPINGTINNPGNEVAISGLNLLETQSVTLPITLNEGTSAGDAIVFNIVVDNGEYDSRTLVTKFYGSLTAIFEDDASSTNTNYNNNGWSTTTQTFVSSPSAITESPNGDYQSNENKTITLSNPIDLSNAIGASVSFFAQWEIETDWDYTQFEISIDNGANWIPQCGNFTNAGSENNGQPTGEPLYDGTQLDWVQEEINLNDYLGETIIARFQFISDGFVERDGFYFDDLTFSIVEPSILDVENLNVQSFALYPNPVSNVLQIATAITDYQITVTNLQGQQLHQSSANNEITTVDFNGFSSGIYLVTLSTLNKSETYKVVKK